MQRLLYSPNEAARSIGCGRSKFYSLLKNGQVRAVKLGRLTKITAEELNRYIRALPKRPSAGPALANDDPHTMRDYTDDPEP
jgi:excisionase family DNA binding protein